MSKGEEKLDKNGVENGSNEKIISFEKLSTFVTSSPSENRDRNPFGIDKIISVS